MTRRFSRRRTEEAFGESSFDQPAIRLAAGAFLKPIGSTSKIIGTLAAIRLVSLVIVFRRIRLVFFVRLTRRFFVVVLFGIACSHTIVFRIHKANYTRRFVNTN